jgi:hypothetical protein
MPHCLSGRDDIHFSCDWVSGVRIAIKTGEIAARDFQPYAMSFEKHHAGWPQFQMDFICFSGG